MHPTRAKFSVALFAALILPALLLARKEKSSSASTARMNEQQRAVHALNRLAFGPRPGDVERVEAMGVDNWIDEQLHPDRIDDHALETRIAPLRTLRMSTRELTENFPSPQVIKAVAEGKQSIPSNPQERAIYQAQLVKYQARQEKKAEAGSGGDPNSNLQAPTQDQTPNPGENTTPSQRKNNLTPEQRRERRKVRLQAEMQSEELLDLPPDERMKKILTMSPEEQRALTNALPEDERDMLTQGFTPQQRETLAAIQNPQQLVAGELMEGKLLRAVYSERQLPQVMTDFWFNHFNVFVGKGADRYMTTSYERDVIAPHALGKFKDLLIAAAQSPAMLFYLDNWLSVGPDSDVARGIREKKPRMRMGRFGPRVVYPSARVRQRPPKSKGKKQQGLNENYARELMELHTLSVNGGYTQADVTEVAKVFTGWTIKQPREGGGFQFEARMHEPGDKMVLGHKIKEGGEGEGKKVLDLLAHNPSTAKFICTKLAQRFVSDTPPPALVSRMQQTFIKKDGDIHEVLKTLFKSPEFWAPSNYRAKVKTPLEFVESAVRASGANVTDTKALTRALEQMGMPLYGAQPPTGYSMKAETWVNSSALLNRMNFALALSSNRIKGVEVNPQQMLGTDSPPADPQAALAQLENHLLHGDVSPQTHQTISKQLADPQVSQRRLDDPARPPDVGAITGLLLGSPEFQRR